MIDFQLHFRTSKVYRYSGTWSLQIYRLRDEERPYLYPIAGLTAKEFIDSLELYSTNQSKVGSMSLHKER